jgi:DNA invertase Pin-like site-specific DNA recombinase
VRYCLTVTDSRALRVGIYVRLSEETESTTSPARQQALSRAYSESRGWTVVAVVEDIDVSASKTGLNRPGLDRLRQLVAAGDVDVIVVWRLDRLARSVLDLLTLLKEWTDRGVAAASATEPVDLTTPLGKAMVALIAIFAEMEADAIKARVRSSIDALRKMGRFAGGTVPYGYVPVPNPDGPGRVLVVDQAEAAVIREIADLLRDGNSQGGICRRLNERRVPAPRSEARRLARQGRPDDLADPGTWRTQSLHRLMTSDHLVGRVTHRGEVLRGLDGLPLEVWTPILSGARLAHLRDLLEPEALGRPRVRRSRLLSGLVRCAECGSKLYVGTASGTPLYRCPSRQNGALCPSPRISATQLEHHVSEEALKYLGDRPLTRNVPLVAEAPESRQVSYREVEEAISDTTRAMTEDDADVPALMTRLAALKGRRAELRSIERPAVLFVVEETGETWGEKFAVADTEGQRLLLEDEITSVLVSPTKSRSRRLDTSRVAIRWSSDE